jgi:hypothetical protein
MCDDQSAGSQSGATQPEPGSDQARPGLSRRGFMHASGAAAALALLRQTPRLSLHSAAREVSAAGDPAYSMAMHIHSSFSEQSGSMDSQLFQAAKNSVDVLWWTDHDDRMDGIGYRKTVHFTSLTNENGGPGERGPWTWRQVESGPLASTSGGGIVTSPYSPNDPVAGGSLHLTAKSTSTSAATFGYYADCFPAGWNYRDNLTGQSLIIDVLLTSGWSHGYLELLIHTSIHEASAGRPAGEYTLSYRFVPGSVSASRFANGLAGVIVVPVKPTSANPWFTATVTPSNDIAALWPDLDYRDFALFGLTLSAISKGEQVGGYLDYLRFNRSISGEAQLKEQIDMKSVLAPKYPGVVQRQGLEVSWLQPHINWFGGSVANPSYGTTKPSTYASFLQNTLVPEIHTAGGLASYNHPYGFGDPPLLSQSQQDSLLAQVAATMLPTRALGTDLIEVGYRRRHGCDLAHHIALWDVMSRNAIFLTGNGTSDDHFGLNWRGSTNNFFTSVWAASTAESSLLAALAAGRSWCGSLSSYRGSLDLLVDGTCPMGSVSVASLTSRKLVARATGIPSGGYLQILRGTADYAGTANLTSNAKVVATYTASQLAGGSVSLAIDTTSSRFVRTQVLNSSGVIIGLSNPVWLLRSKPAAGIPASRAC